MRPARAICGPAGAAIRSRKRTGTWVAASSAIEAEHELVEGRGQMRVVYGPLVGAEQPSLGQRGDLVYPG